MGPGGVLNFSNRTFEEFFREIVGIEIYGAAFAQGSGSKANRMRAFWRVGTDEQAIKMLKGLLEGWEIYSTGPISESARTLLRQIVARLGGHEINPAQRTNAETNNLDGKTSEDLHVKLLELVKLAPQPRGYAFEKFLHGLFKAYGLSPRASFRIVGEQIDGSFEMHHETYLLEARWRDETAIGTDLHAFESKLQKKAHWSRGLFLSYSGFSPDGLTNFAGGNRLVCMDGFDLSQMLTQRLSFIDVLSAKVRRAGETGNPYASVRELFP